MRALVLMLGACGSPAVESTACGPPRALGSIQDPALVELSGIAAAAPGVWYAHNDSGDRARVFVVGNAGEALGTLELTGAIATDWEDIATTPCAEGRCIWISDTGDNNHVRATTTVYRVVAPAFTGGTVPYRAIAMTAEHPINGESLFVDPRDESMYLIDKTDASVYAAQLDSDVTGHWVFLAKLALTGGATSAADLHVDGDAARLLVRTDHALFELDGTTIESVLAASPLEMPVADEDNGEAVAWLLDGSGYVTAGEGAASVLSIVDCTVP